METKNYFERENQTDQQLFCQLQVSKKFRKSMDAKEAYLLTWMVENAVHRSATQKEVKVLVDRIYQQVCAMNACRSMGRPALSASSAPAGATSRYCCPSSTTEAR